MPASRDIYQAVESLGSVRWIGEAYRHTAPQWPPLSGAGAGVVGGRWNAPGTNTIYLAQPKEACIAEFDRMAEGQARGRESFLPRDLHRIAVRDLNVLDLTDARARRAVGITIEAISAADRSACQRVAEAASLLGLQGIVAPSATGVGIVIAAYEQSLTRGQLALIETTPLSA